MKLELYLRAVVNNKIKPLYLKEKCEHCGATDHLHLHHKYEFFMIVDDVLNKLNLEMKDTTDYTSQELYLIVSCVLAEHLSNNYLTLCEECHKKEHTHKRQRKSLTKKEKVTKEQKKQQKIKYQIALIESKLNQKLTIKEFRELAIELNFTNKNGRLISKPKKELEELGYVVVDKKSSRVRYKIIKKINEKELKSED